MDHEFIDKARRLLAQSEGLPILINFISQRAEDGDEEARETLDRWDDRKRKVYREIEEAVRVKE